MFLPYPAGRSPRWSSSPAFKKGWSYFAASLLRRAISSITSRSRTPPSNRSFPIHPKISISAGDGTPDRIPGGLVGWEFFRNSVQKPLLGRTFRLAERKRSGLRVTWSSSAADCGRAVSPLTLRVIGRALSPFRASPTPSSALHAPEALPVPACMWHRQYVWVPLPITDKMRHDRENSSFQVFGPHEAGRKLNRKPPPISAAIGARLRNTSTRSPTHTRPCCPVLCSMK